MRWTARDPAPGRWPAGLLGMLALVAVVTVRFIASTQPDFQTHSAGRIQRRMSETFIGGRFTAFRHDHVWSG